MEFVEAKEDGSGPPFFGWHEGFVTNTNPLRVASGKEDKETGFLLTPATFDSDVKGEEWDFVRPFGQTPTCDNLTGLAQNNCLLRQLIESMRNIELDNNTDANDDDDDDAKAFRAAAIAAAAAAPMREDSSDDDDDVDGDDADATDAASTDDADTDAADVDAPHEHGPAAAAARAAATAVVAAADEASLIVV